LILISRSAVILLHILQSDILNALRFLHQYGLILFLGGASQF